MPLTISKKPKPFIDTRKKLICGYCKKELKREEKKCRQYMTDIYYHEPCWFAKD